MANEAHMARRRKRGRKPKRASAPSTVTASDEIRRGPRQGLLTPKPTITRSDRNGYTEIRFSQLSRWMQAAERGVLEEWADLTRRMLKTDPDLVSVVDTRVDAVASARWELSPPDGINEGKVELARAAAERAEWALRGLEIEQVFRDMLDAIGMGYQVGEILWGRRDGWWVPKDIVALHPRRFSVTDDFELVLRRDVMAANLEGEEVMTREGIGVRLPRDKYIIHQPRQIYDYPTGSGLFMPTARYWWVKQQITKYWLSGAEQQANPRYLGKYPQAAHETIKEELFDAIEALAGDGVGVMSDEVSVETLGGDFTGATEVWERLADYCNAAFAKLWLGSTLNVEIGDSGGNRAAAESQADTTIDPRKERDGRAIWSTLRTQLVEPFLRFNSYPIGDKFPEVPPVPVGTFVFAEDPVEVDQLAVQAGAVEYDELRESRGLPAWGGTRGSRIVRPLQPTALPQQVDVPRKPEGEEQQVEQPAVQQQALNGAQVTSLLEIVQQVAQGLIPRDTALQLITAAFPIDERKANDILGTVGAGFEPKKDEPDPVNIPKAPEVPDAVASASEVASDPLALSLASAWKAASRTPGPSTTPDESKPSLSSASPASSSRQLSLKHCRSSTGGQTK